ncbi:MAG: acetylornithine transaminase [Polyangiales bacterium]
MNTTPNAHPLDTTALLPLVPKPPVVMVRGEGSWLWDDAGQRYLDFVQGWAVNCLGHCPTAVRHALAEQANTLINAGPAYYNAPQLALARELTRRAGLDQAFLCSTGAEANEGAIKLARKWGAATRQGAATIITTHGSFHGRTLATMAASGKPGFDVIFPPVMPGFRHVPFGDVEAVAAAIDAHVCAVMVEPIQGEGGVVVPPEGYLRALRELADARGILLILDEIQTGIGRTGTLFAFEQAGILPDIVTLAKGLGAGAPLAAVLNRRAINRLVAGDQGGTFAGNPLMAAVGLAVLREVTGPGFLDHVRAMGARLDAGLRRLIVPYTTTPTTRGAGLLRALVLPEPRGPELVQAALERGLLINAPRPELLRFMPALNVSAAEIDELLTRLEDSLRAVLTHP